MTYANLHVVNNLQIMLVSKYWHVVILALGLEGNKHAFLV